MISSNQEEGYQIYSEEEEEDSEVQIPQPTSVTPLESEQSEPTRLKTIAQSYEETSPMSPPLDECMVSTDEPMNYAEASREEACKKYDRGDASHRLKQHLGASTTSDRMQADWTHVDI